MGCEICGAAYSLGAMVAGAALTKGEIVQLCQTCREDVGARAVRPARRMPLARAAMLAAAGAAWGMGIFFGYCDLPGHALPWLEFYLGAIGASAIFSAFRAVEEPVAQPRRPAIDQDASALMSNSKLLAHLRAVSDFPEEDFLMLRPNSALARKLQRARVAQPPARQPPPLQAAAASQVRIVGELACPEPRMNTVIKDIERPHPESCGCDHCVAWRRHVALVNRCGVC